MCHPKKSHGVFCEGTAVKQQTAKYAWITEHRKSFPIATMCRVLAVSDSGYYASLKRVPSEQAVHREVILNKICVIHAESDKAFGSPRIYQHLQKEGVKCNEKTVAKYMKTAGIRAETMRPFRLCTTDSNHSLPVADNILNRDFTASKANEKWVGDITYVKTDEGWLFLAIVIDLFSRMIVGWSMSRNMKASLVCDALQMAVDQQQPEPGLIMHSDRGSQYASREHRDLLEQHGMVCSMSRKGNCWDNAVAESTIGTIKQEKVYREHYLSFEHARRSLFYYIEIFYNRKRIHSSIDYETPVERQRTG